jgi:hypothetical protein
VRRTTIVSPRSSGIRAVRVPNSPGSKITSGFAARNSQSLGNAETIITQLGFPSFEGGDKPYATSEYARWRLTQAGVEQLERVRDGGNLTLYVTPEVVLLNHGEPRSTSPPRHGHTRSLLPGSRPPPSPSSSSSPKGQ